MNLVEVSKFSNSSVDELREIVLTQFNRIVLSEYSQLDEAILERLLEYLEIDFEDAIDEDTEYTETNGEVGDLSLELECLNELTLHSYPKIEYTKKLLQYCIKQKFLLFIDTCSLLNDHFYEFYDLLVQDTKQQHTLYVPYVVVEELKNILIKREKEQEVLRKAEDRFNFIVEQCKNEKIKIVGDENDKRTNERGEKVIHADRVIIERLIYFRNDSKNCLLITQDYGVTVDALKQNDWQSTKSQALILVKKIGKGGALLDNSEDVSNPILPID